MSCLTLRKSLSVPCAYSWFTTHGRLISVSKRPSFVPLKIADGQKYFLCHTHVTLVKDKAKKKKIDTDTSTVGQYRRPHIQRHVMRPALC